MADHDTSENGARMQQRERQEVEPTYDDDIGVWFGGSRPIATEEMAANVFRFDSLPAASGAFVDAAVPGHERVLLGAVGGSKFKKLKSQVQGSEYTTIDYVRAGPGNGAALHSHDVEETFICLSGQWMIAWGDQGEEEVVLEQFDGVVVPPGVMRSFKNISESEALLLTVVGGDDPGHVVWAETMREPLRQVRAQ